LQLIDLGIAALFLIVATHQAVGFNPGNPNGGGNGVVIFSALLAGLSIALRRRLPNTSLYLMIVVITVDTATNVSPIADAFVAFPMYQVASIHERRRSLPALAFALVCFTAASGVYRFSYHRGGLLNPALVVAIAAWFVGDSVRTRRTYTAGLAEQAAQRQRETIERAQRSVAEERLQIARDLHDVVAHSLSVIAVQSGVGRHVIDDQPAEAKKALAAVEATSRSALAELRRMLGVLRRDDGTPASLAPAPGVGSLGPLIEQVQMAGYIVDLDVRSTAVRTVTPTVGLSIYRIIQEALTNVVKHAGPSRVLIEIRDEGGVLVVEVNDDGRGLDRDATGPVGVGPDGADDQNVHHGIVGMRERVALYDGSLWAGPRPEGGFAVRAHFPIENLVAS
jgi:signal transduction histidine kinase